MECFVPKYSAYIECVQDINVYNNGKKRHILSLNPSVQQAEFKERLVKCKNSS